MNQELNEFHSLVEKYECVFDRTSDAMCSTPEQIVHIWNEDRMMYVIKLDRLTGYISKKRKKIL